MENGSSGLLVQPLGPVSRKPLLCVGDCMNIQEQQRIYLQTIYAYFHEKAEWPTYSHVDKKLFNIGIDAKEVSASLPNGYANTFRFDSDLGNQAMLSLEAMRKCDGSERDLADFLTAVRFLVDRYKQAEEDHPLITGADLKNQFHMTDDAVARVGTLIFGETVLCSSSGGINVEGYVTWQCRLDREIRRFDGVTTIEDYLKRRNKERVTAHQQATNQLVSLLGNMYRQPNTEDNGAGIETWTRNLTEPNEQTGAKQEVALLNALARLGVPTLFGGDIQCGGPATPRYDLVALNFGAPMQSPTAVLISCKSTTRQPNRTDIALLSDASSMIRAVLPDWLVFGALVNLGEPTADEFSYRQDVRIWKQSHLQALLHAKEYQFIAQFLWTPPWYWNSEREIMWWNTYVAYHKHG